MTISLTAGCTLKMSGIVEGKEIYKYFPVKGHSLLRRTTRKVHAVDGIDISIKKGETLGLVGESGCGKTTLGKILIGLLKPTSGSLSFDGRDVLSLDQSELRSLRKEMQIIFQDPFASLNPRKTIHTILSQPFKVHNFEEDINEAVSKLLEDVGLVPPDDFLDRHPHEFSGGQRQRIAIARAIALKPKFVVADEPVSSLDMSIRGQILNLMKELQEKQKLTYLYITHDLAVVRSICNRIMIMYLGKIMEKGPCTEIFKNPKHPYTKALLSATPIPNPRRTRERKRIILKGEVPSPIDLPKGCPFHQRCPIKINKCTKEEQILVEIGDGHHVACHSCSQG